jgi:hypothetical protein
VKLGELAIPDRAVESGGAQQALVVVDDEMAVASRQDVDFDGVGAVAERAGDRRAAVLGRDGAAAAMRDHERAAHYFIPAVSAVGTR